MLRFSDGTQTAVVGLNETMAELYAEGRQATQETAEELIKRLEKRNYIASSYLVRKEYAHVLLKEYTEYIAGQRDAPCRTEGSS